MSKKSDVALQLMQRVQLRWPIPDSPPEADTLLQKGMILVLLRKLSRQHAQDMVQALKAAYEDWNEIRVCQNQELSAALRAHWKGDAISEDELLRGIVLARDYLQEVFQRTHGLDLAEFTEDPTAAGKILPLLPMIGMATGSYLLWLATGGQMVVHPGLVRVLDRIGLVQRAGSGKKLRELVEPVVPAGKALDFQVTFAEIAERWCDARKPICHECPLVQDCKYGKKAFKEYQVQKVRMEAQRKRDEAKRIVLEKKEAARLAREAAKAKKLAEAEAAKKAREAERKRQVELRKAQAAKAAAQKKAEAQRKEQEKKAAKLGAKNKKAPAKPAAAKPAKKPEVKKSAAPATKKKAEAPAKKSPKPPSKPTRR